MLEKIYWEPVPQMKGETSEISRTMIPGGWLVRTVFNNLMSTCFVPDPNHDSWIDLRPELEMKLQKNIQNKNRAQEIMTFPEHHKLWSEMQKDKDKMNNWWAALEILDKEKTALEQDIALCELGEYRFARKMTQRK